MKKLFVFTCMLLASCALDTTPDTSPDGAQPSAAGSAAKELLAPGWPVTVCGKLRLKSEVESRTHTVCALTSSNTNVYACYSWYTDKFNHGTQYASIIGRSGLMQANTWSADVYYHPNGGPGYWFYAEKCDCSSCWGI